MRRGGHGDVVACNCRRALEHFRLCNVGGMTVSVRALSPWDASWLRNLPGVAYRDNGISFVAEDFSAAYRGIKAASSAVVIMTYHEAMEKVLNELPNRKEIQLRLSNEYNRLWLEGEKGQEQN